MYVCCVCVCVVCVCVLCVCVLCVCVCVGGGGGRGGEEGGVSLFKDYVNWCFSPEQCFTFHY